MIQVNRRTFLSQALAAATLLAAGRAASAKDRDPGQLVEVLEFLDEYPKIFDEPFDEGLEGRLITDLHEPGNHTGTTPTEHFFIRTRTPKHIDLSAPWTISVDGLVSQPGRLDAADLAKRAEPQGHVLLECSGNNRRNRAFGLLSSADWDGVPLAALVADSNPKPEATRVLVDGFDEHDGNARDSVMGAGWIFSFQQLERTGAFLATHMNDEPLTPDHGYPVRLVVPGWYGCSCIKWVNRITVLDDSAKATSQMQEFATRTHQTGRHPLAKEYAPANIDLAAMPVRIEKRTHEGSAYYRVLGIYWGGEQSSVPLEIRFNKDAPAAPVEDIQERPHARTWGVWSHEWVPNSPGRYDISLTVPDANVQTRRLDVGFYRRSIQIDEA